MSENRYKLTLKTTWMYRGMLLVQVNEAKRSVILTTLRILGMSWGVKTTCFEAPGVSLGGSGVSIGGVRILREPILLGTITYLFTCPGTFESMFFPFPKMGHDSFLWSCPKQPVLCHLTSDHSPSITRSQSGSSPHWGNNCGKNGHK